ncbi:MAG: ABC transporter permease subunit [Dehalococcoidia bacterium]
MSWLVWRQHRMQLAVAMAITITTALILGVTGLQARSYSDANNLGTCIANITGDARCQFALNRFHERFSMLTYYAAYTSILAVLLAAFVGAPLIAREVEQGTHRLVWSQTTSRGRWLFAKLWPLLLAAAAIGAVQGLGFLWWWREFELLDRPRFEIWYFDLQGVVPIGYAVFALAIGVTAGAFCQRTIAAMAIAAGAFLAVRFVIASFVREHYMAPKTEIRDFFDSAEARHGWITLQEVRDRDGRAVQVLNCSGLSPEECQATMGVTAYIEYHPADRFWTFQVIELALFLALSAALLAAAWWRVRGRGFGFAWPSFHRRAQAPARII